MNELIFCANLFYEGSMYECFALYGFVFVHGGL